MPILTIAHHSALWIDTFTHTHRADSPRPDYNLTAALKTLRICLGVQLMRAASLYQVHEGMDYGIVWPLLKAAAWAPTQSMRRWISELLSTWPLEGVMVSQDQLPQSNRLRILCMPKFVWRCIGVVSIRVL